MFGLFDRKNNKKEIKDFYSEISSGWNEKLTQGGIKEISINKIVGSVGRSKELDHQFRSKRRGWTDRHQRIHKLMRQGKRLPPIKVFLLRRDQHPEYFIVDGHHRVAASLRIGFDTIRANIIEIKMA